MNIVRTRRTVVSPPMWIAWEKIRREGRDYRAFIASGRTLRELFSQFGRH